MKTYSGCRMPGGCTVTVLDGTQSRSLSMRLDVWNHSPTGFEWGYGGSGPAQLALAICCDVLGDDLEASLLHQDFKWRVIACLCEDGWSLSEEQVREVLAEIKAEQLKSAAEEP